ncbi:MAG: transposase family protein [Chloroflexi bacterium]|nr:transposase family protein [Chloroflexota bacterium]
MALQHGRPDIFNSDQGSQFTSHGFTARLLADSIRISMDGRGRAFDNIFIERLWRSVKYEDIYLQNYETVPLLETGFVFSWEGNTPTIHYVYLTHLIFPISWS